MKKYTEFVCGIDSLKKPRTNIIPISALEDHVDPYTDCYSSLYYFDDEILKYVTDNGSIKGFQGRVGADRVVFDIDKKGDLDKARESAVAVVDLLKKEFGLKDSEIGVYFSGNKGFAIEFKTKGIQQLDGVLDPNIPIYIKTFCKSLIKDMNLEGWDPTIYNTTRIFRVCGTLHQKDSEINGTAMKLFKTSITHDMLRKSTIDDIKGYASKIQIPLTYSTISDTTKLEAKFSHIINNIEQAIKESVSLPVFNNGELDDSQAPKNVKTCIWRLYQGKYVDGRDNALLRIADHERKQGMPQPVVKSVLSGVLELMNQTDPQKASVDPITDFDLERIVKQAFSNSYDFGCYDPVLDSQCSKVCHLAGRKFTDSKIEVVSLVDAYKSSKDWYKNYDKHLVPTGIKTIDQKMPLFAGTMNLIIGKPGTGKTSLMLNIMKHASNHQIPALFFSLDMGEKMLIQRCAPILLTEELTKPISGMQFIDAHRRGDTELMEKALKAFEKTSENVLISSNTTLTVDNIREELDKQENLWGRKVKLVIVDYVQCLKSQKESFANHEFNAHALTDLAAEKNVCVLGLSQSSRSYQKGEDLLAKGSGAWEEKASTQINCFRPFESDNPEYDFIMSIKMKKNRMGDTPIVDVFFDGASGVVRDLTEAEQMQIIAIKEGLGKNDG